MKKANKQKKRVISRLMTKVAENEAREWPPVCIGFVYQPARPQRQLDEKDASTSKQEA